MLRLEKYLKQLATPRAVAKIFAPRLLVASQNLQCENPITKNMGTHLNYETLFKNVDSVKVYESLQLERLLAKNTEESIALFSMVCSHHVESYRTVYYELRDALVRNQVNPSNVILLQENLAADLARKSLFVLSKLEPIYSQMLPIGRLFGGASRMTALHAALSFMQEVGSLAYLDDEKSDDAFKKRLRSGLRGCGSIRSLMAHLKILDPKNDFPYGSIVHPFLS